MNSLRLYMKQYYAAEINLLKHFQNQNFSYEQAQNYPNIFSFEKK